MEHKKNCRWEQSNCEYKETHHYCPHPQHACNCDEIEEEFKIPVRIIGAGHIARHDPELFDKLTKEQGADSDEPTECQE